MRIIAGTHRGRRLAPAPEGVRPTSDRVRESLFSILGPIEGARVLDAFAGTGALGIEAVSRGASELVAVDLAPRSIRTLQRNIDDLGFGDRARVRRGDARKVLPRLADEGRRFDLVFVDPPYDAQLVAPVLELIVAGNLLAEGGRVVVERAKRHDWPPVPGLRCDDERTYGDTVVQFLSASRQGASPAEA